MPPLVAANQIDLYTACLSGGLPPALAARVVAESMSGPASGPWATTAALLALGTDPARAWAPVADVAELAELAHAAQASHHSGTRLEAEAARLAHELRASSVDQAQGRAERAGVLIAMPLTLCFLPAFFILGLAPVVISLLGDVL